MPRRKPAASASPAPRKSPRAATQVLVKTVAAAASPASTRTSRSRSTSSAGKGDKTSPVPSPSPRSRGGHSRSKAEKDEVEETFAEPTEELEAAGEGGARKGRSSSRRSRGQAKEEEPVAPSPRAKGRVTRGVLQEEKSSRAATKAKEPTKAPKSRGRSRGRGKKVEPEEVEEVEEDEEAVEEEAEEEEAKAVTSRGRRARGKKAVEEKTEEPKEGEAEAVGEVEEEEEVEASPARGRRGRGRNAAPAPQKTTPRGRSARGKKQEESPEKEEAEGAAVKSEEPKAAASTSRGRRSRGGQKEEAVKEAATPTRSRRGRTKLDIEKTEEDLEVESKVKDEMADTEDVVEKKETEDAGPSEEVKEQAAEEEAEAKPMEEEQLPSGIETPPEEVTGGDQEMVVEEVAVEEAAAAVEEEVAKAEKEATVEEVAMAEEVKEVQDKVAGVTVENEERLVKEATDQEEPQNEEMDSQNIVDSIEEEKATEKADLEEVKDVEDSPDEEPEEVQDVEDVEIMEAEEPVAPIGAPVLSELSPPAEEDIPAEEEAEEPTIISDNEDISNESEPREQKSPADQSEIVSLDQSAEALSNSPSTKEPEIVSISPPLDESEPQQEDEPEIVAISPAANEIPWGDQDNLEEDVSVVCSVQATGSPNKETPVVDTALVSDTSGSHAQPICLDDDEPVLPSRKRSYEEVEEDEDEDDLSSKKPKVIDLSEDLVEVEEDDVTFEPTEQAAEPLANGEEEEDLTEIPPTEEVSPVEDEPMEVIEEVGSSEPEVPATEPSVQDIPQPPTAEATSTESPAEKDILKDYVVIEMSDVPGAEADAVQQAAPADGASSSDSAQTPIEAADSTETPTHPPSAENHLPQTLAPLVGSDKDPLFSRLYVPNPAVPSDSIDCSKQFSVASYNILADCHVKTYAEFYEHVEPKAMEPSYRHSRLMEEVRYLDSDIVCMQEVGPSYYRSTLLPEMNSLGYSGEYMKREIFEEGEATFYRSSRFTLVQSQGHLLKDLAEKEIEHSSLSDDVRECVRKYLALPDVAIISSLTCNQTGNTLFLANIHVNYGNLEIPNAQCIQISCAIKELVSKANSGLSPHIICGDFNNSPSMPGYQLARDGYLSDDMIQALQASENMDMPDGSKSALVNHLWRGFQHTSSTLKSAYATAQGGEPEVTTIIGDQVVSCVDYVFYSSSSLDTVGVLSTATKKQATADKSLPSLVFPSDHLSVKALLAFR